MIAFTVPLLVVLLATSQLINAYPTAPSIGTKNNHLTNLRLKRNSGLLQRHEWANNFIDDLPSNFDENLPYFYSISQHPNRKRLIDF